VIDFNNILFRESARLLNINFEITLNSSGRASEALSEMNGVIEKAYSDHFQRFSGKSTTEGYVRLQFIENQETKNKGEFRELAIAELIVQIEATQANGVRPGDIAILVRGKREGSMIAKALLDRKIMNPGSNYCYDVISNDSLIIGQSPVVRFILNFFSLFAGQENEILKADLVFSYAIYLLPMIDKDLAAITEDQYHTYLAANETAPELFKSWFRSADNDAFDHSILSLPLFELASRIAENFGLNKIKGEMVYLEAFLDLVLQYGRDGAGGISGFLDWWELSGKDKTITLSEGQNAISILTIHKSKGLEFHTVFIPLCDWEIVPVGIKAPYLWCHPEESPFDLMDLVLVRYGKNLEQTLFSEAYYKEMLYSSVDNLNLLYVAMTRAINSLIVFCPYAEKPGDTYKNIGALIQGVMENPPLLDSGDREKYIDLTEFYDPETKTFELGEVKKVLYSAQSQASNNKELDGLILSGKRDQLKLRLHRDSYLDLYDPQKSDSIGHGKLLHELFENIATLADVIPALKRMVSVGKIDTKTGEEYKQIIFNMLESEPFRGWFSGEFRVLNERDILRGKESRHRPDRVMIKNNELIVVDYKTGKRSESHFIQVRGYLQDFQKMNFPEPKGYIWYLSNNELVELN
jgi:ATP-dependent exoDNAse (exonuclease V) beta subunit